FLKDREWNVKYNIIPALKSGKIVILDRYYYSTIAYQSARGIDLKLIKKLNERFPKPDLVIILDISPETALKRIKVRGEPDKFEKIEFLKKVRENFLNLKDENIFIINAELDLNTVKEKVLEVILKYLQLKTSPFKGMRKV
ncbi:MAG TPA: dTMP kinase, partial [Archaeoglobus profundus]|nr:dTMP kinase [Archaeoglobus profundus]